MRRIGNSGEADGGAEEGFRRRGGCRVATTTTRWPSGDDQRSTRDTVFFDSLTSTRNLASAHLSCSETPSTRQVTHMYSHGNARNDHTVLHYGFLDKSKWEHPRLCCTDQEGANLWNCAAVQNALSDLGADEGDDTGRGMRRRNATQESDARNW